MWSSKKGGEAIWLYRINFPFFAQVYNKLQIKQTVAVRNSERWYRVNNGKQCYREQQPAALGSRFCSWTVYRYPAVYLALEPKQIQKQGLKKSTELSVDKGWLIRGHRERWGRPVPRVDRVESIGKSTGEIGCFPRGFPSFLGCPLYFFLEGGFGPFWGYYPSSLFQTSFSSRQS